MNADSSTHDELTQALHAIYQAGHDEMYEQSGADYSTIDHALEVIQRRDNQHREQLLEAVGADGNYLFTTSYI
jgi:hypothetical protein